MFSSSLLKVLAVLAVFGALPRVQLQPPLPLMSWLLNFTKATTTHLGRSTLSTAAARSPFRTAPLPTATATASMMPVNSTQPPTVIAAACWTSVKA